MARRPKNTRARRQIRRQMERAVQRVRALFTTVPPEPPTEESSDELEGGIGVREPRRPRHPTLSGGVALETPPGERRDTWAVGEDRG